MATVAIQPEQKNVVINPSNHLVFFEDQALSYNYKTDQWTRLPRIDGRGFFAVQDTDRVLGTIETSATDAKMIQDSTSTGAAAVTATVETGEFAFDIEGSKAVVDGVRSISNGASITSVELFVRDHRAETTTTVTGTAPNSRTQVSHFRGGANPPSARWARARITYGGGFTTISAAEFDFTVTGKV
jgi:hypothetical protein